MLDLTGTPFNNDPAELVAQLRLVDRLHDLAPTPDQPNDERAWAKSFKAEWCGDLASMRQLHRVMTQSCYIRRQRRKVLGRPDTIRVPVRLWIDEFFLSGRSLVAYAYHEPVQRALQEHYDCAPIFGGERDPQEQKRRFMPGEPR